MQLMLLMQQHFAQLLHLPEANFSCQRQHCLLLGVVVATARCTWVATSIRIKSESKQLDPNRKTIKDWNRGCPEDDAIQLFKDFPFRVVVLFSWPKHPVWLFQLL